MKRIQAPTSSLLPLLLLFGCGDSGRGDDEGFDSVGDMDTGDGDTGDGDTGDGDTGDGDMGTAETGDGDTGTDGTDGTDSTGTDTAGDPCMGVDCSGHGTCVDLGGEPSCECDEGYVAEGLECIGCPQAAGVFDIDIPMITVSGAMTVNGQAVNAFNAGLLYLINRDTGDSVGLGGLNQGSYSVEIVPGTYDLRYDELNDSPGIPDNSAAIVAEGIVLDGPQTYDIDVPMISVTGTKTVNGQAVNAFNAGLLYFVNRETGDTVGLGGLSQSNYAVEIVPGTYDIRYDELNNSPGIPDNSAAILVEELVLDSAQAVNIDIPMVTITGTKTVNGQTVNAFNAGLMDFVNQETGDVVGLGGLSQSDYAVEIVPGTYDLRYRELNDSPGIPDNENTIVAEGLVLDGPQTVDLDVPMVTITGTKTVNGQAVNAFNAGLMDFVNQDMGGSVSLGGLSQSDYAVELIPGTYSLSYRELNDSPGIPDNEGATVLEDLALDSSMAVNLDIPMITVSGTKTVNGQTVNVFNAGLMDYIGAKLGVVSLGSLNQSNYFVELIPGTYDLRYDELNDSPGIPDNANATVLEDIALDNAAAVNLDVPMVNLAGLKTVNGQPVNVFNAGLLSLVNRQTGDSVDLGSLSQSNYAVEIIPGTYEVRYRELNDSPGIPDNDGAILECVQIQ